MTRLRLHTERHAVERIGWLCAAVLGANDGILSTANLIVGVAATEANNRCRVDDQAPRNLRAEVRMSCLVDQHLRGVGARPTIIARYERA